MHCAWNITRQLVGLRNYIAHPLTILDFNTFGSTEGVAGFDGIRVVDAPQLEAQVDRFAEALRAHAELGRAADAAERAILAHVEAAALSDGAMRTFAPAAASGTETDAPMATSTADVKEPATCKGGDHAQPARR